MQDSRDRSSKDSSSPYNYHHKSNTPDDNTNNHNGKQTLNSILRYRFDVKVELYQDSSVWKIKISTRNSASAVDTWKQRCIFDLSQVIEACNTKGATGSSGSAGKIYGYSDFDFTGTLNFDLFVLNMGTETNDGVAYNNVEISQWNIVD